jgi:hypothetical protein
VQAIGESAVNEEAAELSVRLLDPAQIRILTLVEGDRGTAVLATRLELHEGLGGGVDRAGTGVAKAHDHSLS